MESSNNIVDLEAYRKEQSNIEELATLMAEQYEATYHEPED